MTDHCFVPYNFCLFSHLQGSLVIDGTIMDKSLLEMVIETQKHSADNNVIKFSDNSR